MKRHPYFNKFGDFSRKFIFFKELNDTDICVEITYDERCHCTIFEESTRGRTCGSDWSEPKVFASDEGFYEAVQREIRDAGGWNKIYHRPFGYPENF